MALPSSTSRTVSAFLFRRGIPRSSALYCCIPVRIPRCHSLSSHGKENRLEDFFVSLKRDTASLCKLQLTIHCSRVASISKYFVAARRLSFSIFGPDVVARSASMMAHMLQSLKCLAGATFTISGCRSMGVRGKQQQAQTEA